MNPEHGPATLRRAVPNDAEFILAIRAHPVARRYQPIVPGSLETFKRVLEQRGSISLSPEVSQKVQWTVVVDDVPAGWVTVDVTSREHHIASIGYAIHPDYHGRGLASSAVNQVVTIAFDPQALAIERLEAVAAVENVASRRVLEKCGFELEGIARGYLIISGERVDHARYATLRT